LDASRRTHDSIAPPTFSRLLAPLLPEEPPKANAFVVPPLPPPVLAGPNCADAEVPEERSRWGGGSSEYGGRGRGCEEEVVRGSEVMARLGRCLATKALRPSCAGPGRLNLPARVPTPPGPERRKVLRLLGLVVVPLGRAGALPRAREEVRGGVRLERFVVEFVSDEGT
jgi:hypothetical protein